MTVSSDSADDLTISRYSRCSRVEVGVEHQLGHADDAVHGRADLVAHVGQELALGPAGGLRLLARLLQLVGALGDLFLQRLVGRKPTDSCHVIEGTAHHPDFIARTSAMRVGAGWIGGDLIDDLLPPCASR